MTANAGEGWGQAFLLITEPEGDRVPKKKELFKLFDAGTHAFEDVALDKVDTADGKVKSIASPKKI